VDSQPASLAIFDHAITYVPRLDRYLDGTAEFAGVSELPSQDQGVMVLRVGGETPLWRGPGATRFGQSRCARLESRAGRRRQRTGR